MTKEKGISINVLKKRRDAAIKNLTSGKLFIEGSLPAENFSSKAP